MRLTPEENRNVCFQFSQHSQLSEEFQSDAQFEARGKEGKERGSCVALLSAWQAHSLMPPPPHITIRVLPASSSCLYSLKKEDRTLSLLYLIYYLQG